MLLHNIAMVSVDSQFQVNFVWKINENENLELHLARMCVMWYVVIVFKLETVDIPLCGYWLVYTYSRLRNTHGYKVGAEI